MNTNRDDDKGRAEPARPEDPAEKPDREGTKLGEELSGIRDQQLKREKIDTQTYKYTAILKRIFAVCFIFALIPWPFFLLIMLRVSFFKELLPTEIFIALLTAASVNFLFLAGIIFTREQRLSKPSKK